MAERTHSNSGGGAHYFEAPHERRRRIVNDIDSSFALGELLCDRAGEAMATDMMELAQRANVRAEEDKYFAFVTGSAQHGLDREERGGGFPPASFSLHDVISDDYLSPPTPREEP